MRTWRSVAKQLVTEKRMALRAFRFVDVFSCNTKTVVGCRYLLHSGLFHSFTAIRVHAQEMLESRDSLARALNMMVRREVLQAWLSWEDLVHSNHAAGRGIDRLCFSAHQYCLVVIFFSGGNQSS